MMWMWTGAFLLLLTVKTSLSQSKVDLIIKLDSSNASIDSLFLSVAFPHLLNKWTSFKFSDVRMRNLARYLSPVSVRVYANPLFPKKRWKRETPQDMPETTWIRFYDFMKNVGWHISFNFVNMERTSKNEWDFAKAEKFLEYAAKNKIPIPDFQLGNEPHHYPEKIKDVPYPQASHTVKDFRKLRELLRKHPFYHQSKVTGADLSCPSCATAYFSEFLAFGGCKEVDYFSYHHYYQNVVSEPTYMDLMNVTLMSRFKTQIFMANNYRKQNNCTVPQRLTETGSISGGGIANATDRFIAGFMWIHKLGTSAYFGFNRIYRFNYWGSSYSFLNKNSLKPTAVYFISLLFKRLVEGPVLEVKSTSDQLVAFANCAKSINGAVVVYLMNPQNMTVNLTLKKFEDQKVNLYIFKPAQDGDLLSKDVKINEKIRDDTGVGEIVIAPLEAYGQSITLEPYTYGFIVIPGARVGLCYPPKAQSSSKSAVLMSSLSLDMAIIITAMILAQ